MNPPALSYLVIGHVCQDLTPFGTKWGGTALFGAITALRLGAHVHVLTSMPAEAQADALPAGIEVCNVQTDVPLTFRHEYVDGLRHLFVTATAPPLGAADLPPAWRNLDIVHFGPVAQEVDHALIGAFDDGLSGASIQGWMRGWDDQGRVEPLPTERLLQWAPRVQCSFLSEEDIGDRREVVAYYRHCHRLVVLTDGAHGATVFEGDTATRVPAVPAREVDANGAGDVFATAFLIRYHETGSALVAAQFAAAVASFHVEQVGTAGIPMREQAEARWRQHYIE
jgi:sugar/nucleoside kinase (ribokinase family)